MGFVSQVGLEQGAANGRPAEPPLSRPAPHRRHALGGHGRDAQRADARLRHSSVRASMIYQHATRDRDKSIAAALGKFFDATQDDSE